MADEEALSQNSDESDPIEELFRMCSASTMESPVNQKVEFKSEVALNLYE
jgi:hypothetical protein